MSAVRLGMNQYGKAENRVFRVYRDTDRHEVRDLNVTSQLWGDFETAHTKGTNETIVATDTQKNTIFAKSKEVGIESPEAFLLALADHFTSEFSWVTGGKWQAEEFGWARINDHDHSFYRAAPEVRTAALTRDGDVDHLLSGFYGLTVLKTTASGFTGYPRDKYTTLPETDDRILATDIATRWRYNTTSLDFEATYRKVKDIIMETFTNHYSHALQQTLYLMGEEVISQVPEIDEIRFSCPNKHHFTYDLERFGLENPNEVFIAADRPYGLIEATIVREGAQESRDAWAGIAEFC